MLPQVSKYLAKTLCKLCKYEREILTMLLNGGLRSREIAGRLTAVELNSRQVANRMRDLAKRDFVVRVPSNAGAYWCLTNDGKEVAQICKDVGSQKGA